MRLHRRRGFTLIELLVVIGIIAVLIGILLPVIRSARQSALSVQCMSNLRACGQILLIYANQNNGYFPRMVWDTAENLPRSVTIVPVTLGGVATGIPDEAREYPDIADALYRIVNKGRNLTDVPYSPGGMLVFYCPANYFWDADAVGTSSSHWPQDFPNSGKIKYWYFGNPNPYYPRFHFKGPFGPTGEPPSGPGATTTGTLDWRFWDINRNGDNRDEYIVKNNEKGSEKKLLMTDHSRAIGSANTAAFGLAFVHGKKSGVPISGWKNNLFGDGHASARMPRTSSWSSDGKSFINPDPNPDELQPRWGNSNAPFMW